MGEGFTEGEGPYRREERCVFSELSEVPRCHQSLPGVKGHCGTNAASSAQLEQSDGEPKPSSLPPPWERRRFCKQLTLLLYIFSAP